MMLIIGVDYMVDMIVMMIRRRGSKLGILIMIA